MNKKLWQPPRLRIGEDTGEERRATWLELFYDLIFVVAIAELAHNLSKDVTVLGVIGYVALFIPIWFCWLGATFYANLFDTDDLADRLLTFVQMMLIAALAINVHHGLGKSSIGFAIAYIGARSILIVQFLIAKYHVPLARPLLNRYIYGFGLGICCWVLSLFVPPPWRFALWALGLFIDFVAPVGTGHLATQITPDISHMPERLGLFTMIVLGESVVAVVKGVVEKEWNISSIVTALMGMSIAFSFWWLYFDSIDGSPLETMKSGKITTFITWLYAHLLLAISLVATGVGVEHIIFTSTENVIPEKDRWLLCGAVTLCLLILALINFTTCILEKYRQGRILSIYRLASAGFVLVLAIAGTNLSPILLTTLIAVACVVTVALDLWSRSRQPILSEE
ncbi:MULTISPECIES: low temperature requirement protein A [Calothrix]|uniref:Low temperature requirement protein A n=2 Tax=Calothrix TaxID=1186 RepID=A0ABR8A6M9_9CYAN|nr:MULTISPECIES: low temperature requirement protein A [Calothrix]MBD2195145.1 low temperature requirement protein A [Calothrix parietina FACHB-288]MBD2223884.1 low temperature requirement protein A [Calothrix anomala FACHB-343]